MSIDGEQQTVVRASVTEGLQDQRRGDQVRSLPTELLGERHSLHAKFRAADPCFMWKLGCVV